MWTAALIAAQMKTTGPLDANCKQVLQAQVRYQTHLFNVMNATTTRTPEGGPFKPVVIKTCEGTGCTMGPSPQPILKYEPDHPDADENGMVAYPNLDLLDEMSELAAASAELEISAKLHWCEATFDQTGLTKLISYGLKSPFLKKILITRDLDGVIRSTTFEEFDGSQFTSRIPKTAVAAVSAELDPNP